MIVKTIHLIHRITGLFLILIIISSIGGFFLLHDKQFSFLKDEVKSPVWLWLYGKPTQKEVMGEIVQEPYPPTWETYLLKIHSGQIFGINMLGDLLALSLIILSLTGPYIWMKHRQFKKGVSGDEQIENIDYLEMTDRFKKLIIKESDIKLRLEELHDKIEHLHHHAERKDKVINPKELYSIEQHINELDIKTHQIIKKLRKSP